MRSHKYLPPRFTPSEMRIYALITVLPGSFAVILWQVFGWNPWILLSLAFVLIALGESLRWQARMRRLHGHAESLRTEAAGRRNPEAHA